MGIFPPRETPGADLTPRYDPDIPVTSGSGSLRTPAICGRRARILISSSHRQNRAVGLPHTKCLHLQNWTPVRPALAVLRDFCTNHAVCLTNKHGEPARTTLTRYSGVPGIALQALDSVSRTFHQTAVGQGQILRGRHISLHMGLA
jgi:hypothetical protein